MNSLSIVKTDRAEQDLIEIWFHIAHDSEAAADRLLDRIEDRWQQLAVFPLSGTASGDIAAGVRHLVVGEYLVFYRIDGRVVQILRVLHGRRAIGEDDFIG